MVDDSHALRWQHISFPHFTESIISALDTLYRIYIPEIEVAGQSWFLTLQPLGYQSLTPNSYFLRVSGLWLGYPFTILLPTWLFRETLDYHLPAVSQAVLPKRLFEAAARAVIGLWLKLWPAQDQIILQEIEIYQQTEKNSLSHRVLTAVLMRRTVQHEKPRYAEITFCLEDGLLLQMARQFADKPARVLNLSDSINMCLRCVVGEATLSIHTVKRLQVGDVIFMRLYPVIDGALGVFLTTKNQKILWGDVNSSGLMTVRDMKEHNQMNWNNRTENDYDDDDDDDNDEDEDDEDHDDEQHEEDLSSHYDQLAPQSQQNQEDPLDGVPMTLAFDIGDCSLTLAEVRRLVPGAVIRLDRTLPKIVDIRLNGALLGEGEIIDIDGKIGVLISKIKANENRFTAA